MSKNCCSIFLVCALIFGIASIFILIFLKDEPMTSSAKVLRRILCFGDSLTAGYHHGGRAFSPYGTFLQDRLGDSDNVTWVGCSGWTTRQMIDNADREEVRDAVGNKWPGLNVALDRNGGCDLAIIMAGSNDLGHGEDPETIGRNLIQLYDMVTAKSAGAEIIALGIPDSAWQSHNADAKEKRDSVNQMLKSHAEAAKNIKYYDCPVTYDRGSSKFEPDGLHFSVEGYEELATFLYSLIK